jgi:hypothetical protein
MYADGEGMEYWSNGVIERLPSGNVGNVKRSVSRLFTVAIAIVLLITDYRLLITLRTQTRNEFGDKATTCT